MLGAPSALMPNKAMERTVQQRRCACSPRDGRSRSLINDVYEQRAEGFSSVKRFGLNAAVGAEQLGRGCAWWIVGFARGEHRPDQSRVLGRQRDHGLVVAASSHQ